MQTTIMQYGQATTRGWVAIMATTVAMVVSLFLGATAPNTAFAQAATTGAGAVPPPPAAPPTPPPPPAAPCSAESAALSAAQGAAATALAAKDAAKGGLVTAVNAASAAVAALTPDAAAPPALVATDTTAALNAALTAALTAAKAELIAVNADNADADALAAAKTNVASAVEAEKTFLIWLTVVSAKSTLLGKAEEALATCQAGLTLSTITGERNAARSNAAARTSERDARERELRAEQERLEGLGMTRLDAPEAPEDVLGRFARYEDAGGASTVEGTIVNADTAGVTIQPNETEEETDQVRVLYEDLCDDRPTPVVGGICSATSDRFALYLNARSGAGNKNGVSVSLRGGYSVGTNGGASHIVTEEVRVGLGANDHIDPYVALGAAQRTSRSSKATTTESRSFATGAAGVRFHTKVEPGDAVETFLDVEGRAFAGDGGGGGGALCPGVNVFWSGNGGTGFSGSSGLRLCAEAYGFGNGGGLKFDRPVGTGHDHVGVGGDVSLFDLAWKW